MVWGVKSYNGNAKTTATASEASSTSNRCQTNIRIIEEEVISQLSVYPNPVHELLTITSDVKLDENIKLILTDPAGRSVPFETTSITDMTVVLNLSGLQPGVYMLRLINKNNDSLFRILKQ
jgi:hypothetical protein